MIARRWRRGAFVALGAAVTLASCSPVIAADAPAAMSPTTIGSTPTVATVLPPTAATVATTAPPTTAATTTTTTPQALLAAELVSLSTWLPAGSCLSASIDGVPAFSFGATTALAPASDEKLLTGLTALDLLGADTRIHTAVMTTAPVAGGVINGDLYFRGMGDPLLATADWVKQFTHPPEPRTKLEDLADRIVATGVRKVTGALIGDDGWLDQSRYPKSWPRSYVTQHQTGPLSALNVNDGYDTLQPKSPPAADPARSAAAILAKLLTDRGVTIVRGPASGRAPAAVTELAAVDSAPMRDIVAEALRESDNQTAELLLRRIGKIVSGPGTTDAGAAVVQAHLTALGLPMAGVKAVDGSGLDRGNRVTCALLAAILDHAGPKSDLSNSLSIAGVDGTLQRRYKNTPFAGRFRAKSGSIKGVLSLAGFASGGGGHILTFAAVMNSPGIDAKGHVIWDALIPILLAYPNAPPKT